MENKNINSESEKNKPVMNSQERERFIVELSALKMVFFFTLIPLAFLLVLPA